ncbi:hypothetical protein Pyn_16138 [Prunus yedoensis var. nudiflora]|uniref:Uncharacterized protein n=1 Tax=Prunus yedoensis var. nudiflora TaxID=2094558 RepID=A0A314V1D0_PRUYE|nr:hypothetical protein Pyn_16138 [Prunus yedoensis var. nudiflora]
MDTLTLDGKKAWVESSPTKVFDIDHKTEKVGCFSLGLTILSMKTHLMEYYQVIKYLWCFLREIGDGS